MKKKRTALLTSILALLLCVSMLVGTTFAWFTDSVSSGSNVIAAGVLDVELEQLVDGKWIPVNESTNVFDEDALWEPGYTQVVYLRVRNAGDLALKYQLGVNIASETGSVNVKGNPFVLSDYIEYGTVQGVQTPFASREAARAAVMETSILSNGYAQQETLLPGAEPDYLALVVFMPETVENDANYATGAPAPQINLGIQLTATQQTEEIDSFDNQYDANAAADFFPGFQGGAAGAVVTPDDQGLTTAEVAMDGGDVSAVIPAGVQVTDGASSLALSVTMKDHSEANIQLGANEEMRPLDVHIEGVAEGNTTPMLITLKHYLTTGINTGALKLYHVENGAPVAMTQVANPANHNEFSYDPLTGDVTLALASFSEVAVVADTNNTWNGKPETITQGDGTANNPYIIASAGHLAFFRDEVDAGRMTDAHVKLNNNITLSNVNFDPIGWGYVNTAWNAGGADGCVFKGTFDGNGKTIFDLYQSGWDLEAENGTDYTYTNCGFGLFASASNATFKNLTISGAYVRTECVEMGILVGLSQGSCTYENINIHNSKIANYQRPAGGLIGEVSGDGTTNITDVNIDDDVVVGTLWGDFDAPVGGVIGARWDDVSKNPQIKMTRVSVECRLDVYSDVTSSYQWYAYRRAGMLIGNTEIAAPNENGTNIASTVVNGESFLKCTDVTVEYGGWKDYHYCEFSEEHNSPKWPWVRVEAGENCSAFSNPRWGVAEDANGNAITNLTHDHTGDDSHDLLIPFNQLYGGGQGVYGQFEHDGVTVTNYKYKVEFINKGEILYTYHATTNDSAYTLPTDANGEAVKKALDSMDNKYAFSHWMNAGSTIVEEIPAGNITNYKVYPSFENLYTATFVDQQGNVLGYEFFTKGTAGAVTTKANSITPPAVKDCIFDYWEAHVTDADGKTTVSKAWSDYLKDSTLGKTDITLYPIYTYNGDVNLIPVDNDGDGITDEYKVGGYSNPNGQDLVDIPDYVNGKPITSINANALSSYKGVHVVVIPKTVSLIGSAAISDAGWADNGETVTIYYEGSYAEFTARNYGDDWYEGLGNGSRIFFLNGGNKVDPSQGYIAVSREFKWALSGGGYHSSISYKNDISQSMVTTYSGKCDCSTCKASDLDRPDAIYWEGVTIN